MFLSSNIPDPPNNGTALTNETIIKNVMSLVAEAEIGALYQQIGRSVFHMMQEPGSLPSLV